LGAFGSRRVGAPYVPNQAGNRIQCPHFIDLPGAALIRKVKTDVETFVLPTNQVSDGRASACRVDIPFVGRRASGRYSQLEKQ
jgi:hypothetical protein